MPSNRTEIESLYDSLLPAGFTPSPVTPSADVPAPPLSPSQRRQERELRLQQLHDTMAIGHGRVCQMMGALYAQKQRVARDLIVLISSMKDAVYAAFREKQQITSTLDTHNLIVKESILLAEAARIETSLLRGQAYYTELWGRKYIY